MLFFHYYSIFFAQKQRERVKNDPLTLIYYKIVEKNKTIVDNNKQHVKLNKAWPSSYFLTKGVVLMKKVTNKNEAQVKSLLVSYQNRCERARWLKKQMRETKKEMEYCKEHREEWIESNQTKRQWREGGKTSSNTSAVERTVWFAQQMPRQLQQQITQYAREYKELMPFLRLMQEAMDHLPTKERRIIVDHYQKGIPMRCLATGYEESEQGTDRVSLWRLERRARFLLKKELSEELWQAHEKLCQQFEK